MSTKDKLDHIGFKSDAGKKLIKAIEKNATSFEYVSGGVSDSDRPCGSLVPDSDTSTAERTGRVPVCTPLRAFPFEQLLLRYS